MDKLGVPYFSPI